VGFEATIPASEQAKIVNVLDPAANVIGLEGNSLDIILDTTMAFSWKD
jgi:hypothetical protein